MSHVRLPLVCREFLMTCVETEPLIREDQECKELLLEAMKYHLLPEQRSLMTSQRTLERRPDGMKSYVFAVGKYFCIVVEQTLEMNRIGLFVCLIGGGSLFAIHNECECYNPRANTWMPIASMLWRRSRSGVTSLRKMLYVVGGYVNSIDAKLAK